MARYCGEIKTESILKAAETWKNQCLLGSGSVFSGDAIWTKKNAEHLINYFAKNPMVGKRAFMEKFKNQLEPAPPEVKKLAAEMNWVMLLCPRNIGPGKKREDIEEIWSWSGEPFPENDNLLDEQVLSGIGNAGTYYNTGKPIELEYFIRLVHSFFTLSKEEKKKLLSDGWDFGEWLKLNPDRKSGGWKHKNDTRTFRYMLLFLLFPDKFERIFGMPHRKRILEAFTDKGKNEIKQLSTLEMDKSLYEIRKDQEQKLGTREIDFYRPPLCEKWGYIPPALRRSETKGKADVSKQYETKDKANASKHSGKIKEQAASGDPQNLILYGPPGTGKTYKLNKLKKKYTTADGDEHYGFVTFHQAYSYEDFVEGIRPVEHEDSGELVYRVEHGIFRLICQRAKNDPSNRYALFIDEINRGNIAKIFGELITLIEIDKRAEYDNEGNIRNSDESMSLTLPYSPNDDPFAVPKNLDIYGTMNTADRSIALLDTALRRRFTFEELMPDSKVIEGSSKNGHIEDGEGGEINLRAMLDAMNDRIKFLQNRDLTLGHAYLCKVKNFDDLKKVILEQLVPLLQEYFYDNWEQIQKVFNDVKQEESNQIIRSQRKNVNALGLENEDENEFVEYHVADADSITPDGIRKIYEQQQAT
ncbi:MAG: McrB family protein [Pseudohongiellaceae bacterium]